VRRLEATTRVLQFSLDNSILLLAGAAIIITGVTAGIGFTSRCSSRRRPFHPARSSTKRRWAHSSAFSRRRSRSVSEESSGSAD
jgi:hypothetical protein